MREQSASEEEVLASGAKQGLPRFAKDQKGETFWSDTRTWMQVTLKRVSTSKHAGCDTATVQWCSNHAQTDDVEEWMLRCLEVNKTSPLVDIGMRTKCRVRPGGHQLPGTCYYQPGYVVDSNDDNSAIKFKFDDGRIISDASVEDLLFVRVPTETVPKEDSRKTNQEEERHKSHSDLSDQEGRALQKAVQELEGLVSKIEKRLLQIVESGEPVTKTIEGAKDEFRRVKMALEQHMPKPSVLLDSIKKSKDRLLFVRSDNGVAGDPPFRLVRVNLEDTQEHEETKRIYQSTGCYYVEYYAPVEADLKSGMKLDETRWTLDYRNFKLGKDKQVQYSKKRLEYSPLKTDINWNKVTIVGGFANLCNLHEFLVGPFDFEESQTSPAERVPQQMWHNLAASVPDSALRNHLSFLASWEEVGDCASGLHGNYSKKKRRTKY